MDDQMTSDLAERAVAVPSWIQAVARGYEADLQAAYAEIDALRAIVDKQLTTANVKKDAGP